MKNKNVLFTISLTVTLAILVVCSYSFESTMFDSITAALGFPLLVFTVVSFIFSLFEQVIEKCENNIELKEKELKTQKLRVDIFSTLSPLNSNDDKEIEDYNNKKSEYQQEVDSISAEISCFKNIQLKIEKNIVIPIFYVASLTVLFLALIIPERLPDFLNLKNSTLTLLSFLFAIGEIIIKEPLANIIFRKKINKYHNKQK